jgi:hypothetical protein
VEQRGQVTDVGSEANWRQDELQFSAEGGSLRFGGTSRMTRECHVRICERLGVKFPGPTRLDRPRPSALADAAGPRATSAPALLTRGGWPLLDRTTFRPKSGPHGPAASVRPL